jgi:hypothetical protein
VGFFFFFRASWAIPGRAEYFGYWQKVLLSFHAVDIGRVGFVAAEDAK